MKIRPRSRDTLCTAPHFDSMTKEAYFKILFKLQNQISRKEVAPYLKAPDYDAAIEGHRDQ